MRTKHIVNLKYRENLPPWTHLATHWLAKDIYKFGKENNYLANNNRVKTTNKKMSFYYNDILHYIKNQNPNLPETKATTKVLYTNILQQGSKNHIIFRECQWKNKIRNVQFSKIWNNTYNSYSQPCTLDLLFRLLHHATELKQHICKCNRDKKIFSAKCDFCNKTEDNLHTMQSTYNHTMPQNKENMKSLRTNIQETDQQKSHPRTTYTQIKREHQKF